ncbi:MAG: methyltransferase domain-containing protein [Anaerolineales bacterium]|nr:methyltransferase domain-containing protein [Anaerolineales bacterium]
MNLLQRFMRVFFNLLYHPFAFTYDLVAAVVSFGKWKGWVFSILPFIEGNRILEIGHGPGHLQRILLDLKLDPVAMDESAPMGILARRRLGNSHRLTRALAQKIPFASETFDSVVSTFPSEYIFDMQTLSEAHRVLRSSGRLIVLLAAWPRNPLLAWLFKVTGQSPSDAYESIKSKIIETLVRVKFKTEVQIVEVKSGNLLVVIARKEESKC